MSEPCARCGRQGYEKAEGPRCRGCLNETLVEATASKRKCEKQARKYSGSREDMMAVLVDIANDHDESASARSYAASRALEHLDRKEKHATQSAALDKLEHMTMSELEEVKAKLVAEILSPKELDS